MTIFTPGDQIRVYVGRHGLLGSIARELDPDLHPGVWLIQLKDSPALIEAHRLQIRKVREKRRFFLARFQGTELSPEGFAFPKSTLEQAQKLAARHQLSEIIEVIEVQRHPFTPPPIPEFLLDSREKKK